MKHLGTVKLKTDRLILRRFTNTDDVPMFHHWANDAEVCKYLMWQPHRNITATRQVLKNWILGYGKPNFYQWAIELKDNATLIGSISVTQQDDRCKTVHIGYCIGRDWWGKAYTCEALIRLIHFFFEEVGVNRIEARYDPRNPNSGKVMQKAGLQYEGTLYESDWNNQGICDAAYYAILARHYFQSQ